MNLSDIFSVFSSGVPTTLVPAVTNILVAISPLFLVVMLFLIARGLWIDYVRGKNFLGMKYTVLELKLPKDTFKSPLAMETILHALHNTSDGSYFAQFWKGQTRPWYSLELISLEGQVKFLIWTEDQRKSGVMSALYSQFPTIEIQEREDYTKSVQFDPAKTRIWAAEFIKGKENKDKTAFQDPYPIKTYIDYGLDKDPKEEFRVDPLTHFIEYLGSVKPNQQIWIQFVIIAHRKVKKPGSFFDKTDTYKDEANKIVNDLLMRDPKTKVAGMKDEATGFTKLPTISKGEQDVVESIERNMQKLAFDVGIRALYISPKDTFDTPFGIGGINSGFKQFASETFNSLKSNGDMLHAQFKGVPWEDYRNFRRTKQAELALFAFRRRSFFFTPFVSKTSVFSTEELATLYHFPGATAATPTLERIPSKKSSAPANLPL